MKDSDRQNIQQLVKRLARDAATEELIAFVASHEGMLRSCRAFLAAVSGENAFPSWFLDECQRERLDPDRAGREIERLLQIFRCDDTENGELYSVLELEPGASLAEVKKAFRRLSRQYHPDSSGGSGTGGDSARFIAVCQAYKAILAKADDSRKRKRSTRGSTPWIYRRKRGISPEQKKKNIILLSILAGILFLGSLLAPFIYRKQVMLSQFAAQPEAPVARTDTPAAPLSPEEDLSPGVRTLPSDRDDSPVLDLRQQETAEPAGQAAPAVATSENEPEDNTLPDQAGKPIAPDVILAQDTESVQADSTPRADRDVGTHPASTEKRTDTSAEKIGRHDNTENLQPGPPMPSKQQAQLSSVTDRSAKTSGLSREPEQVRLGTPARPAEAGESPAGKDRNTIARTPVPGKAGHGGTVVSSGKHDLHATEIKRTQAELAGELLRLRLLNFLESYTASYEQKDLARFSSYFTSDALENGTSFQRLRGDYEKLFAQVDAISFSIMPRSWTSSSGLVLLHGRFNVELGYKDGRDAMLHGNISLLLEDRTDSFKVKELSYWFDH